MWAPQLRALPEGWAAVAPDFRGFGSSDPDEDRPLREDARLEDYADDVAALLDALGAGRAAVCGCSMGGYAAFALLRRFPGRVSGLLLADTRTAADSEAARTSRAAMLDLLDQERACCGGRRDAAEAGRAHVEAQPPGRAGGHRRPDGPRHGTRHRARGVPHAEPAGCHRGPGSVPRPGERGGRRRGHADAARGSRVDGGRRGRRRVRQDRRRRPPLEPRSPGRLQRRDARLARPRSHVAAE